MIYNIKYIYKYVLIVKYSHFHFLIVSIHMKKEEVYGILTRLKVTSCKNYLFSFIFLFTVLPFQLISSKFCKIIKHV